MGLKKSPGVSHGFPNAFSWRALTSPLECQDPALFARGTCPVASLPRCEAALCTLLCVGASFLLAVLDLGCSGLLLRPGLQVLGSLFREEEEPLALCCLGCGQCLTVVVLLFILLKLSSPGLWHQSLEPGAWGLQSNAPLCFGTTLPLLCLCPWIKLAQ